MARKVFVLLVVGIIASLFYSFSFASVPQMINYQGKLTRSSGAPLDTTVQMVFSIYSDSGGTSLLWRETQNTVVVEKGIFNVLLGSVTTLGASVFDGSTRYLGVKVGSDAEMTPRKPIVSVAYAFKSLEADTADYARAGAVGGISGSGTTNYIPKFTGSTTLGNSVIYETGGNVGIGTTSPNDQLEITGNLGLPVTTATAGIIKMGGARFIHDSGISNNTFIGEDAGNLTMGGFSNTGSGAYALISNTTGHENTADGVSALYNNTTGDRNTAIGVLALHSNTEGWDNTANGYEALGYNTTGINNTANGRHALYSNTTGVRNTANGVDALASNTTSCDNTANGYQALYRNTTGGSNTANGNYALYSNTTGSSNTANGYEALYSNTTGYGNTALGRGAGVSSGNLFNATAIGYGAVVDASNKVRIGNTDVTSIGGQVGWSVFSDERLKTNVQESPLGLDFILKLKPVTYNSLAKGQEGITYTGLIAQEVEKVLHELGADFSGLDKPKNKDDFYQLRYAEFVMPLIKAIQEQQDQIKEQQEQIKTLEQRVQELEKK